MRWWHNFKITKDTIRNKITQWKIVKSVHLFHSCFYFYMGSTFLRVQIVYMYFLHNSPIWLRRWSAKRNYNRMQKIMKTWTMGALSGGFYFARQSLTCIESVRQWLAGILGRLRGVSLVFLGMQSPNFRGVVGVCTNGESPRRTALGLLYGKPKWWTQKRYGPPSS